MLSICDVIVSLEPYIGEWKQHFFGWDNKFYSLSSLFAQKETFLGKYKNSLFYARTGLVIR